MPAEQLAITTEPLHARSATYIRLVGDLDAHTFEILQETLTETFEGRGFRVILDMTDVSYMSSAGAGVLIGALSEIEQNDGKFVIVGLRPSVEQIFKTLGIFDVFTVVKTRELAMTML
ncbi:MAG TPA: anti-sigma factor antagonist [Planctomycetota bacterium]|jgi:anti-anti-sigma factor